MSARWYCLLAAVWAVALVLLFVVNGCSAANPC